MTEALLPHGTIPYPLPDNVRFQFRYENEETAVHPVQPASNRREKQELERKKESHRACTDMKYVEMSVSA